MKIEALVREFSYNGVALVDPGPNLSPEQVRDMYSAAYPEITSAVIEGPERKADKLVYTFKRAAGTKGSSDLAVTVQSRDGLPYVKIIGAGEPLPLWARLSKAIPPMVERLGEFIDKYILAY